MFVFARVDEARLPAIRAGGLGGVPLVASLEAALHPGDGAVLVIEVPAGASATGPVPAAHIRNLDPYLPPAPVTAAGGLVVRPGTDGPEVLLIFRRGVWDLPKGKCHAGEAIDACARRELQEELGVDAVTLGAPLTATVHGYPERGRYLVKTTHWYVAHTGATSFRPQAEEDIERVAWTRWTEARRLLAFETLRRLLDAADAEVRRAVAAHD